MEARSDKSWGLLVEGFGQPAMTLQGGSEEKYCELSNLAQDPRRPLGQNVSPVRSRRGEGLVVTQIKDYGVLGKAVALVQAQKTG